MANMDAFIQTLQSNNIPVFKPGDEEYERSIAIANLMYRFARPDCVVQPKSTSHVQTVVKEAKSRKIPMTIRNGGHSYAGYSTTDSGISLDLGKMKQVDLDMKSSPKTVTLQGGALWGHAYKKLVISRQDGYIINGGRCPTVGVSGFTLGGGLGPFTRSFGMGSDTLLEATIVTADGQAVTVKKGDDPKSDKGRLFWALCGAGGGNFGVVTQLKVEVQRLRQEKGNVVAGVHTWTPPGAAGPRTVDPETGGQMTKQEVKDFLETMNRFYTTDWPTQVTIDSSWVCDLGKSPTRDLAIRFLVYCDASQGEFNALIDRYVLQKDLAKQLKRRAMEEPSTRFLQETLVKQWSEETVKSFPSDPAYSVYYSFVYKNDRDRIEAVTKIVREEMAKFKEFFSGEDCLLQVTWIHAGGMASLKKRSATAFRWRDGTYHTYIWMRWSEKFLEKDMWGFLGVFKDKLRPYSMMGHASFVNFANSMLDSDAHEKVYYGNNRGELQKIKAIWDKDNYFAWPMGVQMASAQSAKKKKQEAKGGSASQPAPSSSFAAASPAVSYRMANMAVRPDAADRIVEADGHDQEAGNEHDGEEAPWDEHELADKIAGEQWASYTPPPPNNFVGGIQGLHNLGF